MMSFYRRAGLIVSGWVLAAVPACSSVDVGFNSPNPQGRTLALARAAKDADPTAIPEMIVMLASDDSAQRMLAISALERQTGQTLGYVYYAPEPQRLAAQARWRDWWALRGAAGPTAGETP